MIYLDNGATSLHKPPRVYQAVANGMRRCANPGRGGYPAAMYAAEVVLKCRERAGQLFGCDPEQVVFTGNCTQGLNTAIRTLVKSGSRVVISGFEHNAVTRPLRALGAKVTVAGRKLFDWEDTISQFQKALEAGADVAVFTCVSNVFGYILPVEELSRLCRKYQVPFILDAAQAAGYMRLNLQELGAAFIAMPGHKGLLGPQGTGILLCGMLPEPLIYGGTGSVSALQDMPDFLPDRAEAGTLNVPGIAGLSEGIAHILRVGEETILRREQAEVVRLRRGLEKMNIRCFWGEHQGGTLSFLPDGDCEDVAEALAKQGIAVRAGLHCAPLAHESAGTLQRGTVRVSYGLDASIQQTKNVLSGLKKALPKV